MPGSIPSIFFIEPDLLHLLKLVEEVLESERLGGELLGDLLRLFLVEGLLGLFDEGEDVAEVENAARHAVGVERLEVIESLAGGGEDDRAAGDRCHRECGTTTGVAVELREHDAGEVDALLEGFRGVHGILADHRVDDEQHLVRVHRLADVGGLLHELGVDAEAASGVDDDDVMLLTTRVLDAVSRHLHGVADAVARLGGEDRGASLFGDDLQLVHGIRTLQVGGDEQRGVAVLLKLLGELSGERRLTRPLQAREHDHRRRRLGEFQTTLLAAEDADELLVDDLHDLLGRVQRLIDLIAERTLAHLRGECLDDIERDIGVEQRTPDLADGAVDVGGGELSLRAEGAEGLGQPIGERAKSSHGAVDSTRAAEATDPALRASPRQIVDAAQCFLDERLGRAMAGAASAHTRSDESTAAA